MYVPLADRSSARLPGFFGKLYYHQLGFSCKWARGRFLQIAACIQILTDNILIRLN